MNPKKLIFFCITSLVIVIVIGAGIYFGFFNNERDTNSNTTILKDTTATQDNQIDVVRYAFVGDEYEFEVVTDSSGKQTVIMRNVKTNQFQVFEQQHFNFQYDSFAWNDDHTRLYYAATAEEEEYVALSYVDITEPDPFSSTAIPYEDPEGFLDTSVLITEVEGTLLYLQVGDKQFSMDISQGVNSRPVVIELTSKKRP